jgi:hypothetical protein
MNIGGSLGGTIGTVIGGAIGGYIGGYPGAMIGMAIGGFLGRLIDPPDSPKKPNPQGDLTFNSYVRNAPLPVLYGQDKCGGGVIAKGDFDIDVDREGGGKEGPETFLVELDAFWAVAHCEGPVTMAYPYRRWANDKLFEQAEDDIEGYHINLRVFHSGEAVPVGDSYFESLYSGNVYPFPKLKYTCWSTMELRVEGSSTATVPNIAVELRGFCVEEDELDANPIRCAYDFLTNKRYGMGINPEEFNGDPDTVGSPWKIEADYCDELVSYIDANGVTQQEPRFRYSRYISDRNKGFDILTDLFSSCRSLLRYKQGLLEPLIEKAGEVPEYYYSDRLQVDFVTSGGCTVNRIFSDFSDYPDQFWKGASGTYTDEDGVVIEFFIYNQTSTYIDLCDDLDSAFSSGITISLLKDNIKEGSFTFKSIPEYSIPNIYRIEFINRVMWDEENNAWVNEYGNDVIEHETPEYYSKANSTSSITTNFRKIKTIRFGGVKRKTQAMRMAQFFSDATTYARQTCVFITGVEGYQHAVGDIVGVSHAQTGWDKKSFRVVNIEEKEEDEIQLGLLEYNSNVYSDSIVSPFRTTYNATPSRWDIPAQTERFNAIQDYTENKIWLCFKRPEDEPYWYGVRVYVQNGVDAEFQYITLVSITTPSVKLASDITDVQTVIPFDNSTLYGAFPSSGGFWIDEEYITYTSIDAVNFEFEGCVRTVGIRVAHTADKYCSLKQIDTPFITFEDTDVGNQWTIRIVSYSADGIVAPNDNTTPNDILILV